MSAEAMLALLTASREALLAGFVVLMRVGAVMAVLPGFGEMAVPVRVRLVLALVFTVIVTPAVAPGLGALVSAGQVTGLFLATEAIAGLALGIAFRLLVMVLQITGEIAAQSTSLAQIFGGVGLDPQPAMGRVLMMAGLALAMISGLHVRAAEAVILSYEVWPAGRFPDPGMLAEWGIGRIAAGFGLAVTLAMPFVIAALVYNAALGVINKAMPQLMVAFVGAPAITAGGLLLMMLATPLMLEIWQGHLLATLSNPFGPMP